jgi:hypothetical protein
MSLPSVPNDGFIYDLKGLNGNCWWHNTGVTANGGQVTPAPVAQQKPKKYMVIVAGQSNAQGSSLEAQLPSEKVENPKIKQFSRGNKNCNYNPGIKGSIIGFRDPAQHHFIANVNSIGFVRTFCEEFLKENPNSEITVMPCSLGGTNFAGINMNGYTITWDKTTPASLNLYNEMIKDCNSVLSQNPDMEVLCTLYHQGESSIGNGQYPFKLQQLVRDTRNDLLNGKGKEMPFILGTLLKEWRQKNYASDYIHNSHIWIKWAENIGNTDCANFDHISGATPDGMGVHFTAAGLRKMGVGYHQKFKEMTSTSRTVEVKSRGFVLDAPTETPKWEDVCKHLTDNECKDHAN